MKKHFAARVPLNVCNKLTRYAPGFAHGHAQCTAQDVAQDGARDGADARPACDGAGRSGAAHGLGLAQKIPDMKDCTHA